MRTAWRGKRADVVCARREAAITIGAARFPMEVIERLRRSNKLWRRASTTVTVTSGSCAKSRSCTAQCKDSG